MHIASKHGLLHSLSLQQSLFARRLQLLVWMFTTLRLALTARRAQVCMQLIAA